MKRCATRKTLHGVRFAPLVSLRYARVRALRALGGSSSLKSGKGKPLLLPSSSYWRARLLQGFISKVICAFPCLLTTLISKTQKNGSGLVFLATFNPPACAGYLPHLAVRVPRKLRFRGTFGRAAAWAVPLRLVSRGLRSIAQTLRGKAPQGKPRIPRLRLTGGLSLYRASSQKWEPVNPPNLTLPPQGGFGSINPLLKLWGLTAGGGYKGWHECRTAKCPAGVLASGTYGMCEACEARQLSRA